MNEFEWLRQTRTLNEARPPARDLWPGIERRLQDRQARRRPARLLPWSMAAAIALITALGAGVARQGLRLDSSPTVATRQSWEPSDPRLTGAAVELHAARTELAGAIRQAPHAAFLRRLMARTDAQEAQLRRLGGNAG